MAQAADVALLQEVELEKVPRGDGLVSIAVPTSPGRPTGAVVVRAPRIDRVDVEIDGALVAAGTASIAGRGYTLVSAHVTTGPEQKQPLALFVSTIAKTQIARGASLCSAPAMLAERVHGERGPKMSRSTAS